MMTNLNSSQLEFIGSSWSLWPPHTESLRMNIVSGTRKITSDILSVCLTRKGECPLHPDYGIAPELFQPFSDYSPQYWIYHLEEEIAKWVEGLESLSVEVDNDFNSTNELKTIIRFAPRMQPDNNILTFGFYQYQGAVWGSDFQSFLDQVSLNSERFSGF